MSASDSRVRAALPHFVSIPFPVFGPLMSAFILGEAGRYEGFRAALQDLKVFLITFSIGALSLTWSVISLWNTISTGGQIDWVQVIVKSVGVWLALALFGVWNTVSSVLEGVKILRTGSALPKSKIDRTAWRLSGQRALPTSSPGPK